MGERSFLAAMAAAAFFAGSLTARASPWNREDDGLFVATTANYYRSSTDVSRYTRIDSDTYFEFGLTPDWMLGGRVSYGTSISDSAARSVTESGLNEAELYLQRQILRGDHSATGLKLSGVRSGSLSTDAQSGAPTPNMEFEIRALHGRDVLLMPFKVFATAEAAYRRRIGGDADQLRADTLIGIEPGAHFLLLFEAQSIVSLRNEERGFADFDLYKGQVSIVWRKSRRWSLAAGARKEFATRNIAPGTSLFLGLWSEF